MAFRKSNKTVNHGKFFPEILSMGNSWTEKKI